MVKIVALLTVSFLWADDMSSLQSDVTSIEENSTARRGPRFSMPTLGPELVIQSAPGADNASDDENGGDGKGGAANKNSADVPADLPSAWVEVNIKRDLYVRNALHHS